MPYITVEGKKIEVWEDEKCPGDYYLVKTSDWTREVAIYFAKESGLELTEDHWMAIKFLQEYHRRYQIAPMLRIFVKEFGRMAGPEKGTVKYLYELFPVGPISMGCRFGGLPKPVWLV